MVGKTLAHFIIESKLGEGGMGVVYRARDQRLNRPVAIKVLRDDAVVDPERHRRFMQEAQSASALNHPNIVTIHEINRGDVEGRAVDFIVMELIEGHTLDQLIGSKGLPIGEALQYAIQVADALACAHAAGIVHRDLKPGNIVVGRAGHAKVLDFGLAKLMEPEITPEEQTVTMHVAPNTEKGAIVGTVAYMSPEQAEGKRVDARSDIFSFGSVLYEMLSGRRPFSGESKLSILASILQREPEPLDRVPADVNSLIIHCLRKDPARRIQHMDDVRLALVDLQEETASGRLSRPATHPRRRRAALTSLCVIVLLAGGAWFVHRAISDGTPDADSASAPVPLTSYPGNELGASFSPDGNQVAFVWDGEGKNHASIWVKLIGSERRLRMTDGPDEDVSPAWSPDGRRIAFVRLHDGASRAAVYAVPAIGGPAQLVTELNSAPFLGSGSNYLTQLPHPLLAWAEGGSSLLFSDREGRGEPFGLFAISLDNGQRRRLTSAPAGYIGDAGPAVSPDGTTLVFSRALNFVASELYRVRLTKDLRLAGTPERLTDLKLWTATPIWVPGSADLLFSSSGLFQGPFHLWRMRAQTGRTPRQLAAYGEAGWPAYSRARARLVFSLENTNANIWRLPLHGSLHSGAPTKLIASTRGEIAPQYSPDGSKMVFISNRAGQEEVWICDSDGSNPVQLTSRNAALTGSPHWSPNGKTIVFDSTVDSHFQVYDIHAAGGSPRRLTNHPSDNAIASYSRDGRFIYFASNRSGEWQIWKMTAEGGDPVQVTREGGRAAPVESSDGKTLFYQRPDLGVWKRPVAGGAETEVLPPVGFLNWAIAEDGIYFIPPANSAGTTSIQFLPFSAPAPKPVFLIDKPVSVGLSLSPDGRFLVYSQVDQKGGDLMLVENFR